MAHECFYCGSLCFCHGDLDDFVSMETLINCTGCGCQYEDDDDDDDDDDWFDPSTYPWPEGDETDESPF